MENLFKSKKKNSIHLKKFFH